MNSSRLSRSALLLATVLAIFGVAAIATPLARAEPTRALLWKVNGKVLKAGETREITGKTTSGLELENPSFKIKLTCLSIAFSQGSFIANENGQAVSEFSMELSDCSITGNGEKCTHFSSPLISRPIRSEFVLNDLEPGIGNKILAEYDPRTGKEWFELSFEGEKCKFANTIVKNLAFGSLWTDPTVSGGKETEIELGALPAETTSYLIKLPEEPGSVWLWNNSLSKFELFTPTQLEAFAGKAKLTTTLLILLADGEKFGLSETGS